MAKNAQLQSITMLKNKMSGVLIVVVILGGLFIFLNMMIFSKRSFSNLQSSFSSSTKNQTETLSIFAAASLTAPFT